MTIQTINRGAVKIEFPLYAIMIYNGGETQTFDVAEDTMEGLQRLEGLKVPFASYKIVKFY